MTAKPRKRRDSGDLCQLRVELWAGVRAAAAMVDDPETPPELKLRAISALATAGAVYYRILTEPRTDATPPDGPEHIITIDVNGNGHHPV